MKSLNYSEILSAIASAVVCAVKFVNSFARRQHLFDIAATPIDVHSNLLSYPAPTFLFQFRLKCNRLICLWIIWFDLITSREFRRNLFRYSCEATEIYLARGRRRDGRRGGAEPDGQVSRPRLPRADLVWWGVCVWKQSVYFVKCFITNNTKAVKETTIQ